MALDPLALFLRAVRTPEALTVEDTLACDALVSTHGLDEAAYRHTLWALAAILYARPHLIGPSTVAGLRRLLCRRGLGEATYRWAARVLQHALSTAEADPAAEALIALLGMPDRDPASDVALVEAAAYAAAWRIDLLPVAPVVEAVGRAHLAAYRETLLTAVVEPCLLAAAVDLTPALLQRVQEAYAGHAGLRYSLAYLAGQPDVPAATRAQARAACAGGFVLADTVRARLGDAGRRALVVHNSEDAQGDEIVRIVPLVQALLDGIPSLEVTLVTPRPYLYAHPRITPVPIDHFARVRSLLDERFDVVVDVFNLAANYSAGLKQRLAQYAQERRPFLVLSSTGGDDTYVYGRVDVDGRPWAEALGLDRPRAANVYEATFRLLAELGLPLRTGEVPPRSEPVLYGRPCADAEAAWDAVVRSNAEGRPVAVVNPFGGREALKGYVAETLGGLTARIGALAAEGYYVVVLPNGTPWGTIAAAQAAVGALAPGERAHVAIGPDPAGDASVVACPCAAGLPLPSASHAMRIFFSFVARADEVVTVEGWMVHVAYALGKSYRVLTPPYAIPQPWLPYGATVRQRVAAAVDTPAPTNAVQDDAAPPLPDDQPRSLLLMALLEALGACADERALAPLLRALESPDRQVRRAAVQALGQYRAEPATAALLDHLDDTCCEVRAAASDALLRAGRDWSAALGPLYEGQLRAHRLIGAAAPDWVQVVSLREAARRPLDAALRDDYPAVRREAAKALQVLDYYRPDAPGPPPVSAPESLPRAARLYDRLWPGRGLRRAAASRERRVPERRPTILIATPLKDAVGCVDRYVRLLHHLSYPHHLLSLGLLEGDSVDDTYAAVARRAPALRRAFRRVGLWKRDFGYRVPDGLHRGDLMIQDERRRILARSRNYLLARALADEEWVLWLDVDVIEYPPDILEQLLATGKEIVQPHCVLEYGGRSFDRNAWRAQGMLHLDDLRAEGDLVRLDAVGGTMLLVRADLHREGLIFPPVPYGVGDPRSRSGCGEVETEGLGLLAHDMGHPCWGMPHLEIRHRNR